MKFGTKSYCIEILHIKYTFFSVCVHMYLIYLCVHMYTHVVLKSHIFPLLDYNKIADAIVLAFCTETSNNKSISSFQSTLCSFIPVLN